jgi:hypothetical protein
MLSDALFMLGVVLLGVVMLHVAAYLYLLL